MLIECRGPFSGTQLKIPDWVLLLQVLLTTDVAARGLHFPAVDMVLQVCHLLGNLGQTVV